MAALVCDLCGGKLIMGAGGIATCDSCGMEYSMERMKEKVQEIKGTVQVEGTVAARQTGTSEDIAQWHTLLDKLLEGGDYRRANEIVVKILEADPSDKKATEIYSDLMSANKDMTIDKGVLIKYHGEAEVVRVVRGVHTIGQEAFKECYSLKNIILPESVTRIGDSAFESCWELKNIILPEGVTEIGDSAFESCWALKNIILPESVTEIGDCAFGLCSSLKSITIPKSITEIGERAFLGCDSLESITLPEKVTKIGDSAFRSCHSLESITLPKNVIKIGVRAFESCRALTTINIPESVTKIGESAFYDCKSLTSITVPKQIVEEWRRMNLCSYCGDSFEGLFAKKCRNCGRKKDY